MAKSESMSKRMAKFAGETKRADPEPTKITQDKGKFKKVTLYLSLEQIIALDKVRVKRLQEGVDLGDTDRTKLIREGIDLVVEKEGVKPY